ncbi:MAG TPA: hypothetical protein PLU33_07330 [Treponemataceae bacterium]|jgi:hypothetical protein|nr:hypothetical protein [Treponemataceae bacterium]HOS30611.1 hypothetical protein [Treponemataceae bacterium]HQL04939.1 hypothetical protein [Treponemataceae bacterium]
MRIALVHFLQDENSKHKEILKKIEQTASSQGHMVDVFSAYKDSDNLRLTGYDYVTLIIASSPLFGSKIPPKVKEVLASSGTLSGKKGAALVIKAGFSSNKTCNVLMKAMEKEGMVIDYFEVVISADHAAYVGKKIG